jgi:hypothetical protein
MSARHSVNVRWENFRKAKENNGPLIQERNTPIIKRQIESSTSLEAQQDASGGKEVGENKRHPLSATPQLEAMMRGKERA